MELSKCLTINSANISTIVRNNMVKHISFKRPDYDTSFLVGIHTYLDHMITIRRVNSRSKRVTLLNVPPNVSATEVFHLLSFYGKVKRKIHYDLHNDGMLRGHPNGTQHV